MSIKLPSAAIAALLASTLLFAGCGGEGDDNDKSSNADPSETTSQSTDDGSDEGADETDEGSSDIAPLEADTFYETVMTAQQDAGTFKGTVTTVSGPTTMVMDMEGAYTDGGMSAHTATRPDAAQQLESVMVDGVMYLKGDGLNVPEGKWLKFDPKDPANANNPLANLMDSSNPEKFFGAMSDPKAFSLIGGEAVEGQDTNHYQVTLDSATYAKNLDLPAELVDFLPPEITFDMWVDAENRPVKVVQEFVIQGAKSRTEQTYSDYGTEVDIQAPADADTVTR